MFACAKLAASPALVSGSPPAPRAGSLFHSACAAAGWRGCRGAPEPGGPLGPRRGGGFPAAGSRSPSRILGGALGQGEGRGGGGGLRRCWARSAALGQTPGRGPARLGPGFSPLRDEGLFSFATSFRAAERLRSRGAGRAPLQEAVGGCTVSPRSPNLLCSSRKSLCRRTALQEQTFSCTLQRKPRFRIARSPPLPGCKAIRNSHAFFSLLFFSPLPPVFNLLL